MSIKRWINKKQAAVLDDMFSGQFDEQAVLEKHKISRNVYSNWLSRKAFTEAFNRRIALAHLQSRALIARYASLAAAKLVQLTESEKEETARKACLDIIRLPKVPFTIDADGCEELANNLIVPQLPMETASKLLATLAETKKK